MDWNSMNWRKKRRVARAIFLGNSEERYDASLEDAIDELLGSDKEFLIKGVVDGSAIDRDRVVEHLLRNYQDFLKSLLRRYPDFFEHMFETHPEYVKSFGYDEGCYDEMPGLSPRDLEERFAWR